MTPETFYQAFDRLTLVVIGVCSFWTAVFLVAIWMLHYQPVQITRLPTSRRDRIVAIILATVIGIFAIVFATPAVPAKTITTSMVITGCVSALVALCYLTFVCTTIVELRRGVRLRWQQPRQQTDE